jgi:sterol desaturase/sphingolipid hydroxylase (fatty acid hydroxylase superfamily)
MPKAARTSQGEKRTVESPARPLLVVIGLTALLILAGHVASAETYRTVSLAEKIYGPYYKYVQGLYRSFVQLALLGAIALPFQWLFPAVQRRPKFFSYEFWLDVIYWYQGFWLSLLSFYVFAGWLQMKIYGESGPYFPVLATLPIWLQVVIAIWAYDFIVYWRHRMEHTLTPLWAFHAVHHTTEKVDFLTTTRLHPMELLLGAMLNALVTRMGLHPGAAGLGFAIYLHYNYFVHMNVRIRFPGFLKYVFVSPFMHQWHHAKDEAAMGKNVGVVFAWNDWIFGTAYHPAHYATEFGLNVPAPERVGQSYVRHMLYPLQFAWARAKAWSELRARPAEAAAQESTVRSS